MNIQMQYPNFNNSLHGNGPMNPQQFPFGGAINSTSLLDSPQLLNLQMQNMIKTDGKQNLLSNSMAIQQAMHNMNFYGANPALYSNQTHLNSENNLANGGIHPSSNHNLNSTTTFLEGSGASYKQYLKNNKGSNNQLNDSNNSPGSGPQIHHGINLKQFKNKKIIVKHSNIVKKKRQIKIWTSEEDELLKRLCEQLPGKWNEIAAQIPGRNASQCSQRWRRILPTKIRKPWTQEEDQKVIELSEKYGKNWGMIAQHIDGKTGKQVRERYINKLDPSIKKSPWTEEEDQKILDMFLEQGPKWSAISNELTGRPENTVKNRFYSHISRIYLSDDHSFLANKNSDNKKKVQNAFLRLPQVKKENKGVPNFKSNHDVMEEEDDDDYDNDDDHDEDEDDDDDNDQQENVVTLKQINIVPQIFPNINGALVAASQSLNAMAIDAAQKKKQQILSNNGGFQMNANINDRKNLKIEEQEDQDEELMERNPNFEEEEETNNSNKPKNNDEGKDNGFNKSQGLMQNHQNIGDNSQLSSNYLESLNEKTQKLNPLISSSMLAKRGKMIKNLEIPKGDQNALINIQNPGFVNLNPLSNHENESNAITGMGFISQNNLDFQNTSTPQPNYYQNMNIFTNSQLAPLYPTSGMNPHHLNHISHQPNINHPPQMNQHESTSPMFVLNGMGSPAPRSTLPLFKPPMSGLGNTTPSVLTPLINNQYFSYPQSLRMLPQQQYPNYNPIMNQYYMQPKGFPSISNIGGGNHNDVDKTHLDNLENNAHLLNSFNHQNNNTFNNFDNAGMQTFSNFNFAPPTPGIVPTSFIGQNNLQSKNTQNSNQNQNQYQNYSDNTGSNVSIQLPQSEYKRERDDKQSDFSSSSIKQEKIQDQQNGNKFQKILKEFCNLDPESQKKFQMLIGQDYQQQGSQQGNKFEDIKRENQNNHL